MLVIGATREPWLAAKKDEKGFLGFWSKALHLPLPDYASRRVRRPWGAGGLGGPVWGGALVQGAARVAARYAAVLEGMEPW